MNCKEVGRKPPSFGDASIVATELLNSGYEFDKGSVIFNQFRYDTASFCFFLYLDLSKHLKLHKLRQNKYSLSLMQVCYLIQDGPEAFVLR